MVEAIGARVNQRIGALLTQPHGFFTMADIRTIFLDQPEISTPEEADPRARGFARQLQLRRGQPVRFDVDSETVIRVGQFELQREEGPLRVYYNADRYGSVEEARTVYSSGEVAQSEPQISEAVIVPAQPEVVATEPVRRQVAQSPSLILREAIANIGQTEVSPSQAQQREGLIRLLTSDVVAGVLFYYLGRNINAVVIQKAGIRAMATDAEVLQEKLHLQVNDLLEGEHDAVMLIPRVATQGELTVGCFIVDGKNMRLNRESEGLEVNTVKLFITALSIATGLTIDQIKMMAELAGR